MQKVRWIANGNYIKQKGKSEGVAIESLITHLCFLPSHLIMVIFCSMDLFSCENLNTSRKVGLDFLVLQAIKVRDSVIFYQLRRYITVFIFCSNFGHIFEDDVVSDLPCNKLPSEYMAQEWKC